MTGVTDPDAFFRRLPVALYRTAPGGEILYANPATARLLGFDSLEDLFDRASVAFFYVNPEERARWIERIDELSVIFDFDVELRRLDGSTVWVRDTARAVRGERGEVVYYEGCLMDVTDKMEAQKAKDDFIATVSHELRNPIAAILGLGQELSEKYDVFTDEERRELAQLIARQADDASWLIEDLLVAYRADIGAVSIAPEEFDVVKAAGRVLEVVDRPIDIVVLDGTAAVRADPRRTRQILRNLVTNALRYGGPEVRVQIGRVGDRIEVRVEDSGDELPHAEVDQIFRPYVRGSSPSHPKSVGLGLSVSRRLARLMDGDLTYRHQEGWSKFVLSLPSA